MCGSSNLRFPEMVSAGERFLGNSQKSNSLSYRNGPQFWDHRFSWKTTVPLLNGANDDEEDEM